MIKTEPSQHIVVASRRLTGGAMVRPKIQSSQQASPMLISGNSTPLPSNTFKRIVRI